MTKIALVGAHGYIGSKLHKKLQKLPHTIVTPVTRDSYYADQDNKYDIVINCSMPAARFWAKQNPQLDFAATVERTSNLLNNWHYNKFIQISTISARSELHTIYGRHKAAAEKLIDKKNNLIVRLTATFDDTLSKGALIDILNERKVFLDKKSRYSYASLDFVTNWIADNLGRAGIIEVGGKNSVSLDQIQKKLGLNLEFDGDVDIQQVRNPMDSFPDSSEVFDFMEKKRKKLKIKK